MLCPKCSSKSKVMWVTDKKHYTYRRRKCLKCKFVFNTSENVTQGIDYRGIVKEIVELVKGVDIK